MGITIDESDSRSGKVTVAEQERKMVAELKKLGIDVDKDLQVGDMSGDLKSYVLRRDRVQTQKNYVLKVSDAATLGKVFQALAAIDISRMNLIKATRSDLEQIKLELRAEAMKNARRSADTLAEAIGQKAGKAFMIIDNNYYGSGTVYFLEFERSDRYGRFARIPGHENQLLGKRPVRTGITTGPQAPSPGRRGKEPPHRRPAPDTTNYGNDTP